MTRRPRPAATLHMSPVDLPPARFDATAKVETKDDWVVVRCHGPEAVLLAVAVEVLLAETGPLATGTLLGTIRRKGSAVAVGGKKAPYAPHVQRQTRFANRAVDMAQGRCR